MEIDTDERESRTKRRRRRNVRMFAEKLEERRKKREKNCNALNPTATVGILCFYIPMYIIHNLNALTGLRSENILLVLLPSTGIRTLNFFSKVRDVRDDHCATPSRQCFGDIRHA
jgi:hypothetical protein